MYIIRKIKWGLPPIFLFFFSSLFALNRTDTFDQGVEGLIQAMANEKSDVVYALLKQGVNVNGMGDNDTPLTAAVNGDFLNFVRLLLSNGADVNLPNKGGTTPLGIAIGKGNTEIYTLLKSKKATVRSTDPRDAFIHHSLDCLFFPSVDLKNRKEDPIGLLKDLLREGNLADQMNEEGVTPLWRLSAMKPPGFESEIKFAQFSKLLIQHGAEIDWVPLSCRNEIKNKSSGIRPLPKTERPPMDNELILNQQFIPSHSCLTPLMNAASVGNKPVLSNLIEAGAQLNWTSPFDGDTPLISAAAYGDPSIVALLIEKGADVKHRNGQNKTAADVARERGNTKALALLEAGAKN